MNTQLQLQGQRSLHLHSRLLATVSPLPVDPSTCLDDIEDLEDREYLDLIEDQEEKNVREEAKDKKEERSLVLDIYLTPMGGSSI